MVCPVLDFAGNSNVKRIHKRIYERKRSAKMKKRVPKKILVYGIGIREYREIGGNEMTAAVYLNFSGPEVRQRLEDYKTLAVKYCEEKGYDLLVLMQFVGPTIVAQLSRHKFNLFIMN